MLFSGTSHPVLAGEIAEFLDVKLGNVLIDTFPDGEIGVQILENVRGRDVFVVQSIAKKPNFYLMELLILIDALKRASVRQIIAVIPYYGYARQDRKDKGRVPITAKLVADLLEKAGASRVLTIDLHAEQIQGFFNIPVDNLHARPVLLEAIKPFITGSPVIVAPDIGRIKLARAFAHHLHADFAVIDKCRLSATEVVGDAIMGTVQGRDVILVDDMSTTGGTLKNGSHACKAAGAKKIIAVITHGSFCKNPIEGSAISELFMTNTIPLSEEIDLSHVHVVQVRELIGKAIQIIVNNESMSSLF